MIRIFKALSSLASSAVAGGKPSSTMNDNKINDN